MQLNHAVDGHDTPAAARNEKRHGGAAPGNRLEMEGLSQSGKPLWPHPI